MSNSAILVALLALVAAIAGFNMVFRQERVRRLWHRYGTGGSRQPDPEPRGREDDPAHYVLSIFGMMILAFGLTIFAFVTSYALLR